MGINRHSRPQVRKRPLRTSLLAVLALLAAPIVVLSAVAAQAATPSTTLNFTGDKTFQGYSFNAICNGCIPLSDSQAGTRLTASVSAHWTPTATVSYQYSSSLLRQGQTLDLSDTLTPGSGPLTLTWGLTGDAGLYNTNSSNGAVFPDPGSETNITTINLSVSDSTTCPLKLDGDGSYICSATHTFDVLNATLLGQGVDISVPLTTTVSITPDGVVSVRSVTVGGSTLLGPDTLTFHGPSPSTLADNFAVPCTAVPGNDLVYDLTSSSTTPSYTSTTTVNIKIDITVIITVNVLNQTVATIGPESGTMTLTAPSTPVDLGPVLANNIPPTINSPTSYTGNEGQPVQLDAFGTTSVCPGSLTYVWNLSDGGTEYGPSPTHSFPDNGTYSGQLTVTDANGNASKQDFTVTVANLPPVANAGPDTSAVWGQSVAFNGSAVDPSPIDQQTLSYTWDFGDGTPPFTSGGASTTHAYATPGAYTASLTACDKDLACSAPSTRTITVGARNVSLSYLGTQSGPYDTPASLSASLVDQFGQPVNAGTISFAIDTEDEGGSGTNSSGIATRVTTPELVAGSYTLNASYAGDSLYNPATATSPFTITEKATTTTYTGALNGGPNKTITLSASVVDATGKPVTGVTVTFVLGAQTATATTDSSGIATTTLKLAQKNGTYPLTATFAGTTGKYAGSVASATFKLQVK